MKTLLASVFLFLISGSLTAAEKEIRLDRDFGTLYGTLRTPESGCRIAALLIAGSGPTDRNCNSAMGLYTDSFIYLADALEKQGIASLRYDKRGIGASRYDDPEQIYEISFDDYIGDAAAWVAWLRAEGYEKVVLIGHSEGSLISFCVAAGEGGTRVQEQMTIPARRQKAHETLRAKDSDEADDNGIADDADTNHPTLPIASASSLPDAVISLAGAGFPLDRVVLAQLSSQCDIGTLLRASEIFNSLRQGKTVEDYPRELSMLFLPYLQRYWITQLKYDPQEMIRRIRIPVLIVNGTNDIQIPVANADALRKAKPDAELLLIQGMTHQTERRP